MDIVKAFQNNDLTIHVTIQGSHEEPLFRASDIGTVLGLLNIHASIKDFDNSEKVINTIDTLGGPQEVTFLTEAGLYEMLFKSRKPIARQFKKWVCKVIKEIRLNNKYQHEKQIKDIIKQNEQNLLTNFSKKTINYIGYADNEKTILKFGWSDDGETRIENHKRDYKKDFIFEYIYESQYAREIEKQIKNHSLINPRLIEKEYNKKNRVELIQLDKTFTIENVDKIIRQIKNQVESEEQDKNKNSEIDKLKLELIEKDKLIDELKKQPSFTNPNDNYVYIETNGQGNDIYRISSSEEEIKNSKVNWCYKTINAPKIIDLVKILIKNYNKLIDDWVYIEYFKIKQILDFCILIYDHYEVNTDIEKLVHFIGKYNSTRLTNSNKARINIDKDSYVNFINEEIVITEDKNVTCGMLCDQFHKWYKNKYNFDSECDISHIKSLQGHWNTSFRDEFMKTIEEITKIKYENSCINVIDKAKGLNFTKNSGFRGITLKNLENIKYYEDNVYKQYVKEFIIITNNKKDKVSRKEILDHFKQWTIFHNIFNSKTFGKIYAATFITEIIEAIEQITNLQLEPKKTKYRNMGIFIGMIHKNIE